LIAKSVVQMEPNEFDDRLISDGDWDDWSEESG
jgi:hypothetical protein